LKIKKNHEITPFSNIRVVVIYYISPARVASQQSTEPKGVSQALKGMPGTVWTYVRMYQWILHSPWYSHCDTLTAMVKSLADNNL